MCLIWTPGVMMMKIKYNLKKILLEKDELDLVDTTFIDKWDKVPEWADPDGDPGPKWEEYMDDLHSHIKSRLTDYVKNNPDVVPPLPSLIAARREAGHPPGPGTIMSRKYWIKKYMENVWDAPAIHEPDHIGHSRADTWIKDFHYYLDGVDKIHE